ncbi:MAG TPA: hypothetical protein VG479_06290 [Gaiellaceae bacterium]|jgi:hypothetical protein|nr:hypothetical protein [Gaiellaceae bacterium]
MFTSSQMHIALAKARQDDLMREVERNRLVRAATVERPGIRDWIARRLHRGSTAEAAPAAQ